MAMVVWITSAACRVFDPANLGQLTSKLSSTAEVHLRGSSQFNATSERWSALEAPRPNIAVVPGTERDVAETVSFCLRMLSAASVIYGLASGHFRSQV